MEKWNKEEIRWMPYKEYLLHKEWMEILEIEWWETKGEGYEKAKINTENRKKKEEILKRSRDQYSSPEE